MNKQYLPNRRSLGLSIVGRLSPASWLPLEGLERPAAPSQKIELAVDPNYFAKMNSPALEDPALDKIDPPESRRSYPPIDRDQRPWYARYDRRSRSRR